MNTAITRPNVLLVVLFALHFITVDCQFPLGSSLYEQEMKRLNEELTARLKDHPELENIFYPNKYMLPTTQYVYSPPKRAEEYTQNVIFDPCREYDYDCCMDTFGTPEFVYVDNNPNSRRYGERYALYDDGTRMEPDISRRPNDEYFIDPSCLGENLPIGRTDCVMQRLARRPFRKMPVCWNWNETIVADKDCRSPADGSPLPFCFEVGVTQTSFILECGGEFADSDRCGTYLEIHRSGSAIITGETRLRANMPSGYRNSVLSTTYMKDSNRTICYDPLNQGAYEVWWVQRTLYNFIVERIMPFKIISPECDWDPLNNRYLPYATLFNPDGTRKARVLAGLDPFDLSGLRYTAPRTEAVNTTPGKGMGGTFIPATEHSYPEGHRFRPEEYHNYHTYTYVPTGLEFTVKRGVIEPSFEIQKELGTLAFELGYRALEGLSTDELDTVYAALAMKKRKESSTTKN